MAEITIKLDLAFSRRVLSAMGAAAVMLSAVPELNSESVVLSTYYPAPMGVYKNLVVTKASTLARDGGLVGIGTASPTAKLQVAGNLLVSGANALTFGTGGGAIRMTGLDANNLAFSNGAEFMRLTNVGLAVGAGNTVAEAPLDILGDLVVRAQRIIDP